jgi:hypothetical protein
MLGIELMPQLDNSRYELNHSSAETNTRRRSGYAVL